VRLKGALFSSAFAPRVLEPLLAEYWRNMRVRAFSVSQSVSQSSCPVVSVDVHVFAESDKDREHIVEVLQTAASSFSTTEVCPCVQRL
jgi:hypothetical protein